MEDPGGGKCQRGKRVRSRGKAGGDKGRVAGRKQHEDNTRGIKTEEVVQKRTLQPITLRIRR
jgi:hypothetical protein